MLHQIQLKKHEFWKVPDLGKLGLRVVSGEAWVTFKGCPLDFILKVDESLPALPGEALIEALSESLVLELKADPKKIQAQFELR